MTTEISLVVPEDRKNCISWLSKQSPSTVADILDGLDQMCTTISSPDIQRMQKEYNESLAEIKKEHSHQLEVLESTMTAEKDAYQHQLKEFLKQEVRRQIEESKSDEVETPIDSKTEDDISTVIMSFYTDKNRLPRNIGDVIPQMSEVQRNCLLSNPSLYDSALAKVKRNHYKSCGGRKRKSNQVNDNASTSN
jgi:hypothetical protein